MTNQEILDNAPCDDWTHVDDSGVYYRHVESIEWDVFMSPDSGSCWRRMPNGCIECPASIRSRKDIERIVELEEKIKLAVDVASNYSYIDGAHHKNWVINEMVHSLLDKEVADRDGWNDPDWLEECIAP